VSWTLNTDTHPSFNLPEVQPEQPSAEFIAELKEKMAVAQLAENVRFKARLAEAEEYAVPFPQVALKGSLADLANLLFKESEVPIEFGFMAAVTMFGIIAAD
jgi:hypothetical protein